MAPIFSVGRLRCAFASRRGVHIELEPVDLGLQFRGLAERRVSLRNHLGDDLIRGPFGSGAAFAVAIVAHGDLLNPI
jgi:hypothetical protein